MSDHKFYFDYAQSRRTRFFKFSTAQQVRLRQLRSLRDVASIKKNCNKDQSKMSHQLKETSNKDKTNISNQLREAINKDKDLSKTFQSKVSQLQRTGTPTKGPESRIQLQVRCFN